MSWPYSPAKRHFRMAREQERWVKVRTVCGTCVERARTIELRAAALVDCVECMVVKDAWLELPKAKPLTVRRCRELWAARFDGHSPLHWRALAPAPVLCNWCMQPEAVGTHETCEATYQGQQAQVKAERAARQVEAVRKAAQQLVEQRQRALATLEKKLTRLTSNIRRAARRLRIAQRKLEKIP